VGYSIGDMGASIYGVVAIQAALYEREKSGEGQWIDVSMLDSQVALCENAVVRYCATGEIPKPQGSRHPLTTPFQVFFTKDGAITLLAGRDDHWARFCKAADKEEWITDESYGTNINRLKNYAAFEKDMNALMRTKTSKEWAKLFDAHEIMWGPVNNIEDVVNDPHINSREMIVEVDHPRAGKHRIAGTPMKFSRTPCQIDKGAPELGADNPEILSDWLGLSDAEIRELRDEKVI
jgi:CoA:oxalate CoA-transferase